MKIDSTFLGAALLALAWWGSRKIGAEGAGAPINASTNVTVEDGTDEAVNGLAGAFRDGKLAGSASLQTAKLNFSITAEPKMRCLRSITTRHGETVCVLWGK